MRKLKILLFTLGGAVMGGVIMYLLFPLISDIFVGKIHGEDQMSLNAAILFIGLPLLTLVGGVIGFIFGLKRT